MNTLLNGLINQHNTTLTENGATTYKSTLNGVLDFFAMGGALRTASSDRIVSLFNTAFAEDNLLAMKALFNVRNIRGGAGERKTFRTILKYLATSNPELVIKNIPNIVQFGRYDDLFELIGTTAEDAVLGFIDNQLAKDISKADQGKPISLLAKWMPSINTSSKKTVALAHKLAKELDFSPREYRVILSELRQYIDVTERKMSANRWQEINYQTTPSRAGMIYRKAFAKHDPIRYQQFINDVKSGKAKINAGTLFPHDIVKKILHGEYSDTLNVQWDSLPNYLEDNDRNILTVVDCSMSMFSPNHDPISIAIALGIYTAEHNKGAFHNYFMTYSDSPTLQRVGGRNIYEKVNCLRQSGWGYSTNIQAVFKNILQTAINNHVPQKDMPSQVLIISDVEFNNTQNRCTNLDAIKQQYIAAGYEVPQLVFWNVNSRQNNVPATADEQGVLLVSGASPSVFKTLLSGKHCTPIDQMLETLNQEMYNCVVV